jgi:hypothetical protein
MLEHQFPSLMRHLLLVMSVEALLRTSTPRGLDSFILNATEHSTSSEILGGPALPLVV